jgi:hypothetical protein
MTPRLICMTQGTFLFEQLSYFVLSVMYVLRVVDVHAEF